MCILNELKLEPSYQVLSYVTLPHLNVNTRTLFQEVDLSLTWNYLGIYWHAMFNIHFHIIIYTGIHISIAKLLFFSNIFFFWNNRIFMSIYMSIIFLVLSYLATVSLCYNYPSLYDFLFIHSEVSVSVLEKSMFKFSERPID